MRSPRASACLHVISVPSFPNMKPGIRPFAPNSIRCKVFLGQAFNLQPDSVMESEQTIFMKKPEGLTRILSIDEDVKELWQAREIEAMWRHQLAAPLGIDLEAVISVSGTELR